MLHLLRCAALCLLRCAVLCCAGVARLLAADPAAAAGRPACAPLAARSTRPPAGWRLNPSPACPLSSQVLNRLNNRDILPLAGRAVFAA